jgi:hypothetical protein
VTHARWWATVLVAGAALLGFLLWPSKPTPAPSRSLATPAEVVPGPNLVLMAPTRAPSSAEQTQSADEFKLCNSEFASAQQAPSSETQQEELASTAALRQHVLKALSAGESPETRALGAWLAAFHAGGEAYSPFVERIQLCKTDFECMKALSAEALVAVEEASRSQVDEMVRQAVNSSSPAIYAMAVSTCHRGFAAQSPSCQQISTERWTQLDPGDAGPWLHLLEEASARHETATADEAFYRASIATSLRTGTESFLGYAEPALSSGFSAADRIRAEWDIYLAQGTAALPPMAAAVQQCSAEAVRDSNRRQTCDAFTTMLLDKSSSLIGFHVGVRMAERLEWPAERLSALRQQRAALDFAAGGWSLSQQPCETLRSFLGRRIEHSPQGELAHIRESIAASGKSFQDLAQEAERHRQQSQEPAGTASAASGS